jgi:predicted RNase H-like HicB family nuclease
MQSPIILEQCEEGGYHAWAPALPGCHSEGDTESEALERIREAIALYLSDDEQEHLTIQ